MKDQKVGKKESMVLLSLNPLALMLETKQNQSQLEKERLNKW
jgi:hypothetical protein